MPDENPTLDQLFPTLAPALQAMEGFGGGANDPLRSDPDHHGVTDADIEAYFNARLNGPSRTLPPVVPGQVPVGPTFRSGTTGAPPVGGMEASEGGQQNPTPATPPRQGNQPTNPSPAVQPAEMPQPFQTEGDRQDGDNNEEGEQGGQEAQRATEEGQGSGGVTGQEGQGQQQQPATPPPAAPPTPQFVDLGDGRQVPIDLVRAYDEFNARLAADPELQALIQQHVTGQRPAVGGEGGRLPATQPSPSSQSSQPSAPRSPFDAPPEEFADDPAFMALWNVQKAGYEAQQQQLAQVAAFQQQQYNQYVQEQQARNEQYANLGIQQFQSQRPNLAAEDVQRLRQVAARLNVIPTLLSGVDPVTGQVTSTDPVHVVARAMEIAYQTIPEYRSQETQQATTTATEQVKTDQAKRKKAGSLSGSSGSVPRTTPAPTTPEGNRAAMLQEVGAMMSGTWEGNQG